MKGASLKTKKSFERIWFLDYLRIFSAFAVVMVHCVDAAWLFDLDINSKSWLIANSYESIIRWCVPVFVMISGALFLGKNISTKELFTKYILRLIIVFAVWSAIYLIPHGWDINLWITGHFHMWFLPMIIGLYCLVPLLQQAVKSKNLTKYLLILFLIISILIPNLLNVLIWLPNDLMNNLGTSLRSVYLGTGLGSIGYAGYFILGYYLTKNKIRVNRKYIYLCGIIGTIIVFCGGLIMTLLNQKPTPTFFEAGASLGVLMQSIAIFVIAKEKLNHTPKFKKIFCNLSSCTLGIYLSHMLFIELALGKLSIFANQNWSVIYTLPLEALICFMCGWALTFVLKKIPIIRKYVV